MTDQQQMERTEAHVYPGKLPAPMFGIGDAVQVPSQCDHGQTHLLDGTIVSVWSDHERTVEGEQYVTVRFWVYGVHVGRQGMRNIREANLAAVNEGWGA